MNRYEAWTATRYMMAGGLDSFRIDSEDDLVAYVPIGYGDDEKVVEGRAHIIEAGPEMLKALTAFPWKHQHDTDAWYMDRLARWRKLYQSKAIAKAEGRLGGRMRGHIPASLT